MAIKPTISLRGLRSSASQTGKSVKSIQSSLTSNIKQKKNLYSSIKIIKKRREERDKRNLLQTQLIAPTLVRARGGAKSLATTTQQGLSIGDRLMGFLKYAAAGWLLSNIPTWVALGNQLVVRLKTAGGILSNYGDETLKVLTGITNVFSAALTNISSFDFLDSSSRLKNSFEDLMANVDDLGQGILSAFNVILQPFTDIPPLGSDQLERERQQQEQDSGTRQPQPPSGTRGGNSDFWTLVAVVSREDGDPQGQADVAQSIYNRVASGAYGSKNIRQLILRESQYQPTWERPKPRSDRKQIPNPEWYEITDAESAAKATGFSVSTIKGVANNITNPTLQKEAVKFVGGRTDFKASNNRFSGSIQRKAGDNNFGWQYGYSGTTVGQIPNLGLTPPSTSPPPARPVPSSNFAPVSGDSGSSMGRRPARVPFSPFKPNSGAVITSVMGLRKGKPHTGYDLASPSGTPLYAYFSGIVTHENRAPGRGPDHGAGYGYWIIWKDDVYGSYHFFGHMLKPAEVKKGQRFNQGALLGYVGSTGRSTGPHLHWEISKDAPDSMGNFKTREDISSWLKNHPIKKTPTQVTPQSRSSVPLVPTPAATTTQEEQQAQIDSSYREGLAEGITQERQGRKVVVIDDRSSPIIQQIMAGNGGDGISFSINESALLNNFIKNKLLLDLNYV
jgi:murein DD-endopeptidase MepM/ murein hydrolase activator NlpD